jgi:acyl dehydratase
VTRTIEGFEGLRGLVGEELGVSGWHLLDQVAIDRFAEATGDHYFIHVDPERARREGGLDSTIAHGLLTLSLGPMFTYEIIDVEGVGSALNYGYGKVRFTAPVPVGSSVRMRLRLGAVEETDRGVRVTYQQSFEIDGGQKPACIADSIFFYWRE